MPKQLLSGLEDNQFDLCLGLELPASAVVTREEVFSTRMAGFSAPPMSVGKRPSLEQFCQLPLVLPPRTCGTRTLLEDTFKRLGIGPRILMEVDDVSTIIAIVKAGIAATILPRVLPNISRALVLTEFRDFIGEVKWVLMCPKTPTPEAKSFMEIAREIASVAF